MPKFNKNQNKYLIFEYEFWIKYINYICKKYNDSLTIHNFVNFIEQFYTWIDKNKNNNINYDNFKKEIINNINQLFDYNTISNFLQKYQIKNINELFEKYKLKNSQKYKEIKINEDSESFTWKELINCNIFSNTTDNKNCKKPQNELSNNIRNINMNANIIKDNMNNIKDIRMNNNMGNNINYNKTMKIIKNDSSNYESSYANAALQGLSSLDCISKWINELNSKSNLMVNFQASITKEFYLLFFNLYHGNKASSTNLLLALEEQVKKIYKKDMKKDVYHFLFYLLDILHIENNCSNKSNIDIDEYKNNQKAIQNMKNDKYMYQLFSNFLQKTANSIISRCFYNIEKYYTSCSKCDKLFCYSKKKIIILDIDKILSLRNKMEANKIGSNINLKECFYYYQYENYCKCPVCKDPNSKLKKSRFNIML